MEFFSFSGYKSLKHRIRVGISSLPKKGKQIEQKLGRQMSEGVLERSGVRKMVAK